MAVGTAWGILRAKKETAASRRAAGILCRDRHELKNSGVGLVEQPQLVALGLNVLNNVNVTVDLDVGWSGVPFSLRW